MGKNASDPEYLMRHAEYHGIWKLEESFERMAVPRLRAEEGEGRGLRALWCSHSKSMLRSLRLSPLSPYPHRQPWRPDSCVVEKIGNNSQPGGN